MHFQSDLLIQTSEEPSAACVLPAAELFAAPPELISSVATLALSLVRGCRAFPETLSKPIAPTKGNPQGEKKRASRSKRSISKAVNSLACIQARAESGSYLAKSPMPSSCLRRLKTNSTCQRPRYKLRAWGAESSLALKEVK